MGSQGFGTLSPPDDSGLGGVQAVATGPLTAIAWVSVEANLSMFLLIALSRGARVLWLGMGGQRVAVVFDGGTGGRWGEGGAEAQAVAQSPPILLALSPDTPCQCLLHLLATAQKNIHQLHVWAEQREADYPHGACVIMFGNTIHLVLGKRQE